MAKGGKRGRGVSERVAERFAPGDPDACWVWRGSVSPLGYGRFHYVLAGRTVYGMAHRLVYEMAVGEIPAGMDIDHLCRNRRCVNPGHLEPVTHRENCRRGAADRPPRKACRNGHRMTEANTFRTDRNPAHRRCRECARAHGSQRFD